MYRLLATLITATMLSCGSANHILEETASSGKPGSGSTMTCTSQASTNNYRPVICTLQGFPATTMVSPCVQIGMPYSEFGPCVDPLPKTDSVGKLVVEFSMLPGTYNFHTYEVRRGVQTNTIIASHLGVVVQ